MRLESKKIILGILSIFFFLPFQNFAEQNSSPCLESSTNAKPFDLVQSGKDRNGICLQPKWGSVDKCGENDEVMNCPNPGDTDLCKYKDFSGETCSSSKKEIDTPRWYNFIWCVWSHFNPKRAHGHVNWGPTTYNGRIWFSDIAFDEDFTFQFEPNPLAGLTSENPSKPPVAAKKKEAPRFIHAEFNKKETIDNFLTKNWVMFREAASGDCLFPGMPKCEYEKSRPMITDKRAVVTGLFGLDSEHTGYSELHPVYTIAIEMSESTDDNVWMLFIRKNGNEGFCSSKDHPLHGLPENKFRLLIPKPKSSATVTGAELLKETKFSSNFGSPYCPTFEFNKSDGVIVNVIFPSDEKRGAFKGPILEGEVHIRWTPAASSSVERQEAFSLPEPELELPLAIFSKTELAAYSNARKARVDAETKPQQFKFCDKEYSGPIPDEGNLLIAKDPVVAGSVEDEAIDKYYCAILQDLYNAAPDKILKLLEGKKPECLKYNPGD